jgi:ABC-type enterochelin transport system permease subunit
MNLMNTSLWKTAGLFALVLILLGSFTSSILFGATQFDWHTAWASIFHYDENINDQIILRTTRVPRACIAAAIGASLAIAGVLMQTLTADGYNCGTISRYVDHSNPFHGYMLGSCMVHRARYEFTSHG